MLEKRAGGWWAYWRVGVLRGMQEAGGHIGVEAWWEACRRTGGLTGVLGVMLEGVLWRTKTCSEEGWRACNCMLEVVLEGMLCNIYRDVHEGWRACRYAGSRVARRGVKHTDVQESWRACSCMLCCTLISSRGHDYRFPQQHNPVPCIWQETNYNVGSIWPVTLFGTVLARSVAIYSAWHAYFRWTHRGYRELYVQFNIIVNIIVTSLLLVRCSCLSDRVSRMISVHTSFRKCRVQYCI